MIFNSVSFGIFFAVTIVILFILPNRLRLPWILVASIFYYGYENPLHLIFLAISIFVTWTSALLMDKSENFHVNFVSRKTILIMGLLVNFGMLFVFKYSNFILEILNGVLTTFGVTTIDKRFEFTLPIGISFYIFAATGYLIDVYRQNTVAERNLLVYSVFSSFFPNIMSGPIERANHLIPQLKNYSEVKLLDYDRIASGLMKILWGFFMKMVIADRIAIFVDTIYSQYYLYGSTELLFASVGYTLQIYCDFASYSIIAVGCARIMGIELFDNFDAPYLSESIKEFWRRWHISLSSWLRDYVYIPLGGSRCSKPRKYFNVLVTFFVSGLWHGAAWNFIFWGVLHGVFQMIGDITTPIRTKINNRFHTKTDSAGYHFGKIAVTFFLVNILWIFFRVGNFESSLEIILRIFSKPNPWVLFDDSLYNYGLERKEVNILAVSLLVLILVDLLKRFQKQSIDEFLEEQPWWFRWLVVIGLFFATLTFGIYGPGFNPTSFIYFQF